MTTPRVHYGWIKTDQAAAIPGLAFGPSHLTGKTRSGRLPAGDNNLIGKDVLFVGEGKGALDAVVRQMLTMNIYSMRCGIFPGMQIEKFQASEYGDDVAEQVTVEATEADTVHMPFHVHVFPNEPSKYSFSSLVKQYGVSLTGFIPGGGGAAGRVREIGDAVISLMGQVEALRRPTSPLEQAMQSKDVCVLLTSRDRTGAAPILSYSTPQPLPVIARQLQAAIARQQR